MSDRGAAEPAAGAARLPTADALARLYRRATFGIRPGTERVARMLDELGVQLRHRTTPPLAFAHVAGTNGKGSVCAMIEALAREHGRRTALYTSPHLVRFHERIRVDGRPIGDAALATHILEVEQLADRLWPEAPSAPTFFEVATVVAFRHFDLVGADVRVIEVGMGGALDATNVLRPTVAVITGIDLDHTRHLGDTRAQIAREKAGIIKPGTPVVIGPLPEDAREVVERTAAERGAPLYVATDLVRGHRLGTGPDGQLVELHGVSGVELRARLPLLGPHQTDNLATAMAAFELLLRRIAEDGGPPDWPTRPDAAAVRRAIESVVWPARMQRLETEPEVWLDGAHNPQAARVLATTLAELGPRPTAVVAGMMADKDAAGFFHALAPQVACAWTVPVANERAAAPAELARVAVACGISAEPAGSLEEAIARGRAWAAARSGRLLITGSLYLAGEVLAARGGEHLFDPPPAPR
ncbi:MAG: bifunctional folylpolyglutamate synthase/dihydrofolate synthase [Kiritimatiellae bacterium]|nr:bifunctional folylpolyglutamate synthase/dihydrofolate synthase [Kiritimatiellia bacterium]